MDRLAKFIWLSLLFIFIYLIYSTINENSSTNSDGKLSNFERPNVKIETFSAAKEIIPGQWDAVESISGDLKEHNLLIFKKDGTVMFGQGSSIESANSLAMEGNIKGKWSILDKPDYLTNLIDDQRFLIEIDLGPNLGDLLRVEIDPIQHKMGRIADDNDAMRESAGLFTFGGKIFYKQ